ncbi:MAG: transcriptional regulator [Nitrososphaeria archaeon]|jgi:predicted DNA-binding transcriptional regulator
MNSDQLLGAALMIVSILLIFVYGYLIYFYPLIVLQITAFVAVAAILVILAWIGYTLLTTPAPKPVEESTESQQSDQNKEQK